MLSKDTKICISISSSPSNFGTTVHNAAYEALGLNFLYKAFKVSDLEGAIAGVRALKIRGCSVSMPFKESVIPLLDGLDQSAKDVGAVNTIVNRDNCLTGFNTDVIGAEKALSHINIKSNDKVLLMGAGGVSKAVLVALKNSGVKKVVVANRTPSRASLLAKIHPITEIEWLSIENHKFDVLINATPIGMIGYKDNFPFRLEKFMDFRAVMDVVVSEENTDFISHALKNRKEYVDGNFMSFEQAAAQFELYTGHIPPREVMREALSNVE